MKFETQLQREIPASYRAYSLNYKQLKEQIFYQDEVTVVEAVSREALCENLRFQELLERELAKVNRFARLEIEHIDTENAAGIPEKLVDLEKFVRLNRTGFRKICKKFDKLRKTNLQFWFMARVERTEFANIDFLARLPSSEGAGFRGPGVSGISTKCFIVPGEDIFGLVARVATGTFGSAAILPAGRVETTVYRNGVAAERIRRRASSPESQGTLVTFANRSPVLREFVDAETFASLNLGDELGCAAFTRFTVLLDAAVELTVDQDFSFLPDTADSFDGAVLRLTGASPELEEELRSRAALREVAEATETLAAFLARPRTRARPRPAAASAVAAQPQLSAAAGASAAAGIPTDKRTYREFLVRVEPKTFFANERVLLDWVHVALVFAGIATTRPSTSNSTATYLAAGAMVVVLLALRNFLARKRRLLNKATSGYFRPLEPLILTAGVLFVAVSCVR